MVEVMVTVGVYDDEPKDTIWMEFKSLPRVGDLILPNAQLKRMIDAKKKQWNTSPKARINYVKTVAHTGGGHPILMLSFHPSLFIVDLYYDDEVQECVALKTMPDTSDLFTPPGSQTTYVVTRIQHFEDSSTLYLQEQ